MYLKYTSCLKVKGTKLIMRTFYVILNKYTYLN